MKTTLHLLQGVLSKSPKTASVGEDLGNWNPWALLIGTGNGTVTVEIDMVVPQNIKLELLYDMAIPLVLYIQDN